MTTYTLRYSYIVSNKSYCVKKTDVEGIPEEIIELMWYLLNHQRKGLKVYHRKTSPLPEGFKQEVSEWQNVNTISIYREGLKTYQISVSVE
jgi:hypothetical protein